MQDGSHAHHIPFTSPSQNILASARDFHKQVMLHPPPFLVPRRAAAEAGQVSLPHFHLHLPLGDTAAGKSVPERCLEATIANSGSLGSNSEERRRTPYWQTCLHTYRTFDAFVAHLFRRRCFS